VFDLKKKKLRPINNLRRNHVAQFNNLCKGHDEQRLSHAEFSTSTKYYVILRRSFAALVVLIAAKLAFSPE
jgi:hypothetical protein